ncbi:uncharacterized protein MELLADRAFT_91199 [Melampsora larici-populina 98AG31]|uniref:DUF7872 domain-containing protein n=1 Tax=Melampsora larici-populina (strain 98AG31 / pathotype 3-4-7) TaxID=747676 RepID=F4RY63_MELLP|nr:uncharacterized protein MELLADRAFT_91199 [Melampsora larici-populina 98AG31]EGG02627.1 hypothetical protein MELLADRAFT_91199 [Melampsora larici-populina 98AG31]
MPSPQTLFFLLSSLVNCSLGLPNFLNTNQDGKGISLGTDSEVKSDYQSQFHLPVQENLNNCLKEELNPELWREMDMDQHLRGYPGGFNLTFPAYADVVGATNFQCGIGNQCNPSQASNTAWKTGVEGKDWYALAAAHRWNTFNNQVYEATAYSIAYISDLTPSMVDDLIPEASMFWTCAAVYVGIMAAWICGTPAVLFGFGALRILWLILMSSMFLASGAVWVMANLEVPDPHKFTRWTEILYQLQDFESHMQSALTKYSSQIIESAISSDDGLYGIAKNGTLFTDLEMEPDIVIQSKIQKAFITRGSQPCDGDGPAGALSGSEQMSYCDNSGIMMNIVLVGDNDEETPPYNAPLIKSKYGLSTELLTETAWKCQQKFGGFEHPSIVNVSDPGSRTKYRTNPYNTDSDCVFNLPVCDFTDPD